jgi:hypothetical protein
MRRAITPLFALSVFAFVLFSGALLAAIGRLVSNGDPAPAPWQWWAFVALLGVNLVLLVGGTLLQALRQRRRRR